MLGLSDSGVDSGSSPEMAAAAAAAAAAAELHRRGRQPRHQQQQPVSPMTRTHQYRKVMKPLLERKRRARINKCLDELKDLMVGALQTEGESINKLEKADVLELTVKHLRKLKKHNALGLTPEATYAGRFKAGYSHCAQEVSKFVASPSCALDVHISTQLLSHLGGRLQALEAAPPSVLAGSLPPLVASVASPPPSAPLSFSLLTSIASASASASPTGPPAARSPPSVSDFAKLHPHYLATPLAAEGAAGEDKAWRPW